MPSDAEVAYHRSFLSPYYLENLRNPGWFVNRRTPKEVETIRLRDEEEFEEVRESLARAIKRRFVRGEYALESNVPLVGERREVWRGGQPEDYLVAEVIARTQRSQGVVRNSNTGMIALPVIATPVNAFVDGNPPRAASIYAKSDQHFEKYATPWEIKFSSLVPPLGMGFAPVINDSHQVIGHYGEVSGTSQPHPGAMVIWIPLEIQAVDFSAYLAAGGPTFVDRNGPAPPGWKVMNFYTSEHKVMVKTGVDGEVMNVQTANTGFLTQPWYTPGDIFFIGSILAKLATAGVKVTGSLIRRATAKYKNRAVLAGPTKGLAKEAVDEAKKSMSKNVSKMAKDPPRPLTQQEQELTNALTDMVLGSKKGTPPDGIGPPGLLHDHIKWRRQSLTPDLTQAELALREAEKILRRGLPSDPVKRKQMGDLADRLRTELNGL